MFYFVVDDRSIIEIVRTGHVGLQRVTRRFSRPRYTAGQAQQVVDWLNGRDQPLPLINVADRPGRAGTDNPIPVMRPITKFRVSK